MIFTDKFRIKRLKRVENGITGTVIHASSNEDKVTIRTRESQPRKVQVDTEKFSEISLAYAVHIRKGQGLTSETSGILAGGWQTDKEHMYVSLSRARERTDVYVSREDLGEQGMDTGAIERLGERMARSRAQEATITKDVAEPTAEPERTPSPSGQQSNPRRSSPTTQATPEPSSGATRPDRRKPRPSRSSTPPSPSAQPSPPSNTSLRPRPSTTPSASAQPRHHSNTSPRPRSPTTSPRHPAETPLALQHQSGNPARDRRDPQGIAEHASSTGSAPPTSTAVALRRTGPRSRGDRAPRRATTSGGSQRGDDHQGDRASRPPAAKPTWSATPKLSANTSATSTRSSSEQRQRLLDSEQPRAIDPEHDPERAADERPAPTAEPTDGRDPNAEQAEKTTRDPYIDQAIQEARERQQDHEPERESQHEPPHLERDEPTIEQAQEDARDPYIEQAIQEARERQESWDRGIDPDRDNDRGFGIE